MVDRIDHIRVTRATGERATGEITSSAPFSRDFLLIFQIDPRFSANLPAARVFDGCLTIYLRGV